MDNSKKSNNIETEKEKKNNEYHMYVWTQLIAEKYQGDNNVTYYTGKKGTNLNC